MIALLLALAQDISLEEKRLATIPRDAFVRFVVFSPDGRHVAFAARDEHGSAWSVSLDGAKGDEFTSIDQLSFAPDGKTPVYRAAESGKYHVVVGAKRSDAYERLEPYFFAPEITYAARQNSRWRIVSGDKTSVEFDPSQFTGGRMWFPSPDGKKIACVAGSFVVVNTERGEDFEQIWEPLWSADGSTLAYEGAKDGAWYVVVGGKKSGPYERVGTPALSADGRVVAFASRKGDRWSVRGAEYDRIGDVVVSADGRVVAYAAHKGDQMVVVVGEKESEPLDSASSLAISDDGSTVACIAVKNNAWCVFSNGKLGPAFQEIESPAITANVVHYRARRNGKSHLVVGDHVSEPCEAIEGPVFGAGGLWAYRGWRNRKWFVVTAGKKGAEYDEIRDLVVGKTVAYPVSDGEKAFVVVGDAKGPEFAGVGTPVFGPDGTTVAYPAWIADRKMCMVVGDKKGATFFEVGTPRFSPDGKIVAYRAIRDGCHYLVVGDQAHGPYDEIWPPVFAGGKAAFGARSGNELWWKVTSP